MRRDGELLEQLAEREHAEVERFDRRAQCLADLVRLALDVGVEQRLADDGQCVRGHLARDVEPRAVAPLLGATRGVRRHRVGVRRDVGPYYETYKIRIGRSLLLGLEVLVAADIVKTIALDLTFLSLGLLAGLVLVRTFLSWTLVLEIEGRWPWQRKRPWPSRSTRAFESIGERTAALDVRECRPPHPRLSTQEPMGISTAGSVRGLIDPARLHSTPNERV